jgi:hypothetical protein
MGEVSDSLNKYCSVYSYAQFEVKHIVRECLISFPYMWASIFRVLIYGPCLMTLDVTNSSL